MTAARSPARDVLREGTIGRTVLHARIWNRMQRGEPVPRLFFDNKSPVRISVHRLGVAPDESPAKIGREQAARRGGKCEFFGWAELSVADASGNGRTVCASGEWWHADIILPCEESDEEQRRMHAEDLAANAVCRSRP